MARPRGFDPDQALDAAQHCFELRGYEATSVDDLVQAMGLSRASIYGAFGDKRQLFDAVLDRYETRQQAALRGRIAKAATPRAAIRMLFASLGEAHSKLGCLLVNSGVELGPTDTALQDRVRRSLDGVHSLLRDLVRQIPPVKDADTVAAVLAAVFLGLRVQARTGMPRKRIMAIGDRALEKILPPE